MPKRPQPQNDPEATRSRMEKLLSDFSLMLKDGTLRQQVLALVESFRLLRSLGSSLIPRAEAPAARDRILRYLLAYPLTVIHGDELMVVSGIQDWPRRVRELRVQFGWNVASGLTLAETDPEDLPEPLRNEPRPKPDEYVLLSKEQDRDAAHRWHAANEIRRGKGAVKDRILTFLLRNVGRPVSGEELRYVAGNATEWARRVRELRTEEGWAVATAATGRPDLPVGTYILEHDRQSPPHDRRISDATRASVLARDGFACTGCGWRRETATKDDPRRNLELHHVRPHAEGGGNEAANLVVLCNVCHDEVHSAG